MALFDDPPHSCSTYTVVSGADSGGGVSLTYSLAQSSVPCSVNTSTARTRDLYSQAGIEVSHTVAFLSAVLTTALTRGMKLVASEGGTFRIEGIRSGRVNGNVPALTYADVSEIL